MIKQNQHGGDRLNITIEAPAPGAEDEIIVRCKSLSPELRRLLQQIQTLEQKISAFTNKEILALSPGEIYYFESVDNHVFAYTAKEVFEVKQKLYELETDPVLTDFARISKSVIVSVSKIVSVSPMLNGRLEAKLKNGERVIISRQYVSALKKKLGIGGKTK